jgi:hypothetical protein
LEAGRASGKSRALGIFPAPELLNLRYMSGALEVGRSPPNANRTLPS